MRPIRALWSARRAGQQNPDNSETEPKASKPAARSPLRGRARKHHKERLFRGAQNRRMANNCGRGHGSISNGAA